MIEPVDSAMSSAAIDVNLRLHYRHGWGQISLYAQGLREGSLKGARCQSCSRLWIPPRRVCTCSSHQLVWETHSGRGIVEAVTEGASCPPGFEELQHRVWVLVRWEGACAAALAVFDDTDAPFVGQAVRMVACGLSADRAPVLSVRA